MADHPLVLDLLGRPIPETRMQVADVELLEPPGDGVGQFEGAAPNSVAVGSATTLSTSISSYGASLNRWEIYGAGDESN